jgi:hypothetical protein
MAFHLKPKEERFFSMLDAHSQLCYEAAILLQQAFNGEIEKAQALAEITVREKKADDLVMATLGRLQKTFITPMDREDIQLLIDQLDSTIDAIKEIMDKTCMYQVGEATEGTKMLAAIVMESLKEIRKSISYMNNLKKNYLKVEARSKKVIALEEQGDDYYHAEMAKLFSECKDPIEIIKWKEILSAMEDVIDDCEKLVATFRRVVLKYA